MNQLLDTHLSLLEEEVDTVAELSWSVPTQPMKPNLQQTDKCRLWNMQSRTPLTPFSHTLMDTPKINHKPQCDSQLTLDKKKYNRELKKKEMKERTVTLCWCTCPGYVSIQWLQCIAHMFGSSLRSYDICVVCVKAAHEMTIIMLLSYRSCAWSGILNWF